MAHKHHHDHDHEHTAQPRGAQDPGFDPAAQSLADALQFCFTALKVIMVILVVVYFGSGFFNVESNKTAVQLRFGKIIRADLSSGGPYFSLPYPIDEVIHVDLKERVLDVKKAFWFEYDEKRDAGKTIDEMAESRMGPLNPVKDGSLITGDANIVHTQWSLTYLVYDPKSYVENVGDDKALAHKLVELAAEQAVVKNVAQLTADDLLKGVTNAQSIKTHMQGTLDGMKTGLEVKTVSITQMTVPLSTRPAFQAVLNAENEKAREIESAQEQRVNILSTAAGEAHDQLLSLVEKYEMAVDNHTQGAELDAINDELDTVLNALNIDNTPISGEVAGIINEAQVYRTSIVEKVQSEAQKLEQLYDQFKQSPRIIQQRLIQDARREILSSDMNETFYVTQDGQQYLELNRDPSVKRERERKRLQLEQESRQNNR
ncbi:MAG: SPFH domain-containing protein [Phycisphaeraceae bacterium JB051]